MTARTYDASGFEGTKAAIATLETECKTDRAGYFGTKASNGGRWSGNVEKAKAMNASLRAAPPVNDDARSEWQACVDRLSRIIA